MRHASSAPAGRRRASPPASLSITEAASFDNQGRLTAALKVFVRRPNIGPGFWEDDMRKPKDRQAANFSPMMPQTMSAMQASLIAVAGSPSSQMPSSAVPTVPMPVHTA